MNKDQKIVIVKEDMTTTEITIPSYEAIQNHIMMLEKKRFKYTAYFKQTLRRDRIRKIISILAD